MAKKITREEKTKDIQKNLHNKARLKRNYLKLLEKEGYSVPEKEVRAPKPQQEEKPQLKYQDKKQKIKERKQHMREKIIQKEQKVKEIKQAQVERQRQTKKLQKTNKYGQPKMGPRIENLLNKIKNSTD